MNKIHIPLRHLFFWRLNYISLLYSSACIFMNTTHKHLNKKLHFYTIKPIKTYQSHNKLFQKAWIVCASAVCISSAISERKSHFGLRLYYSNWMNALLRSWSPYQFIGQCGCIKNPVPLLPFLIKQSFLLLKAPIM